MGKRKQYTGRVYLGKGEYRWVGRFDTRRERDQRVAEARVQIARQRDVERMTVNDWAARYLARYERSHKASSLITMKAGLKAFLKEMGDRPLRSITRVEAMDWAHSSPPFRIPAVAAMFSAAVDAELIDRNPFRGLTRPSGGRSGDAPPTGEEFARLLDACKVHGWYAPRLRALATFAAYSGMRPGELFMMRWPDIDFDRARIQVARRLYRGGVDTPKSGRAKLISLTPPARTALASLPRDAEWVFLTKRGLRFSQSTLSEYWRAVTRQAGLDFEFYLATKHFCVHYLWAELNLSRRAIAQQMGWSLRSVDKMLAVYGHGEIGALDEVDRAFARNVVGLRAVESDATGTQEGA